MQQEVAPLSSLNFLLAASLPAHMHCLDYKHWCDE